MAGEDHSTSSPSTTTTKYWVSAGASAAGAHRNVGRVVPAAAPTGDSGVGNVSSMAGAWRTVSVVPS